MFVSANVSAKYWHDRQGEPWVDTSELGSGLRLTIRLAHTTDGVAVDAVLVERIDGRALAARDLRRVKMPPAPTLAKYLDALSGKPTTPGRKPIAPARPGSVGHSMDHWRQVYELWEQAMVDAPRAPVKWVRDQYRPKRSDATVRRWVQRARKLHDEGML